MVTFPTFGSQARLELMWVLSLKNTFLENQKHLKKITFRLKYTTTPYVK